MKILVVGPRKTAVQITRIFSNVYSEVRLADGEKKLKAELANHSPEIIFIDDDFFKSREEKISRLLKWAHKSRKPAVVISSKRDFAHLLMMKNLGASDCILRPFNERELVMRVNAVLHQKTRIACIGGGTGLFHLLMGLKSLPGVLLTSIVSISDDGGSSGKLSESLGVLPPGDIRRSLVALSNAPEIMNQIMQYRFDKKGDLEGHSFGNIFLAALAGVKGTMSEAVRSLSDILYLQGIVLPASKTMTKLVARFEGGILIKGESRIDRAEGRSADLRVSGLFHEPEAEADADAVAALLFADYITIGPGDLFTSIITNLIIKNIREAIVHSHAKKIYICNLMTKPGETSGFDAADHVSEIVKYLGADSLDYVLISNTRLSRKAISVYAKKKQAPVNMKDRDSIKTLTRAKMIVANVGDSRELVRHDSANLKNQIQKIMGLGNA